MSRSLFIVITSYAFSSKRHEDRKGDRKWIMAINIQIEAKSLHLVIIIIIYMKAQSGPTDIGHRLRGRSLTFMHLQSDVTAERRTSTGPHDDGPLR